MNRCQQSLAIRVFFHADAHDSSCEVRPTRCDGDDRTLTPGPVRD
jgi:hypothetical protein